MKGSELCGIAKMVGSIWDVSLAHLAEMRCVHVSQAGVLTVKSGFVSVQVPVPGLLERGDASISVPHFIQVFGNLDSGSEYRIVRHSGKLVLQENGRNILTFTDGNVTPVGMLMSESDSVQSVRVFDSSVIQALSAVVEFAGMKEVEPFFRGVHFSDGCLIALDRYRLINMQVDYDVEISIFESAVHKLIALFRDRDVQEVLVTPRVLRVVAGDGLIADVMLLQRNEEKLRMVKEISAGGEGVRIEVSAGLLERLSRICEWIGWARKLIFDFECVGGNLTIRGGADVGLDIEDTLPVNATGDFKFSVWMSELVELLVKVTIAAMEVKERVLYVRSMDNRVQGYLVRLG